MGEWHWFTPSQRPTPGEFPFTGDSGRSPARLHICDSHQWMLLGARLLAFHEGRDVPDSVDYSDG